MPKRQVIGLHGLPGVGKDVIADYLVNSHGFVRLAFADAVKAELIDAFALRDDTDLFTDRDLKVKATPLLMLARCRSQTFIRLARKVLGTTSWNVMFQERTPRWIMQMWGTEFRRGQNHTYWIDKVARAIDELPPHQNVVVTDVRFPDEAGLVQSLEGDIWEIVRPNNPLAERIDGHTSNRRLPDYRVDVTISNDASIEELEWAVEAQLLPLV